MIPVSLIATAFDTGKLKDVTIWCLFFFSFEGKYQNNMKTSKTHFFCNPAFSSIFNKKRHKYYLFPLNIGMMCFGENLVGAGSQQASDLDPDSSFTNIFTSQCMRDAQSLGAIIINLKELKFEREENE